MHAQPCCSPTTYSDLEYLLPASPSSWASFMHLEVEHLDKTVSTHSVGRLKRLLGLTHGGELDQGRLLVIVETNLE